MREYTSNSNPAGSVRWPKQYGRLHAINAVIETYARGWSDCLKHPRKDIIMVSMQLLMDKGTLS